MKWLHVFSICILGIATNLDNLCIGMAYGCQGRRIGMRVNATIALVSGLVSLALCWASSFVAESMRGVANCIGALLLIGIGLWTFVPRKQQDDAPVENASAWVLGLALAINCIPAALGAGLTGLSSGWLGLAVAGFSFVTVGLGNRLGCSVREKMPGRLLDVISALCMVGIGLFEMLC